MVLKNKRITSIAYMILLAGLLMLYTKIGGVGMIYAAGSIEIFYVTVFLFLGGLPDAVEYTVGQRLKKEQTRAAWQVCRAAAVYSVFATALIELLLFVASEKLADIPEILYVNNLLKLSMFAVPFLALLQLLCGIYQAFGGKTEVVRLFFSCCMVSVSYICYIFFRDYGEKAAALLQKASASYFYILIGIVIGVMAGAIGAVLFLIVLYTINKNKFSIRENGRNKERIWLLCTELFKTQAAASVTSCMKHVPLLVLLWLSLEEIAKENYLFGHFYGVVLPALGILSVLCDMGLTEYKKRLYTAYRKKQGAAFYQDYKAVLCYTVICAAAIASFFTALHKSYLSIWDLQTFTNLVRLTMLSGLLGLFWLPCLVLEDVAKCRSMYRQILFSVIFGTLLSIGSAAAGSRFMETGAGLYVLCIGVQLFATATALAWNISIAVGIHYLSIVYRAGSTCLSAAVIGLMLFGIQTLAFTAFGGIATIIICTVTGIALLLFCTQGMHVFSRSEYRNLPFSFITRLFS